VPIEPQSWLACSLTCIACGDNGPGISTSATGTEHLRTVDSVLNFGSMLIRCLFEDLIRSASILFYCWIMRINLRISWKKTISLTLATFQFLELFAQSVRLFVTRDQHVARQLPTHRTTQTRNKRTQFRHPCLEWDSNTRAQRSSERRQFMP
jgi:hypothetical protein